MPDSKIREFGQWITAEEWIDITAEDDPSIQVVTFEKIIENKIDIRTEVVEEKTHESQQKEREVRDI